MSSVSLAEVVQLDAFRWSISPEGGMRVPGVLFASRKIDRKDPALVDIAPTVLRLFGIWELPALKACRTAASMAST